MLHDHVLLFCKKDHSCRKAMEDSTRPEGRSFACTHLKMVKIKCLKNDSRVHTLAQLFLDNGIQVENIYVRQRSTCESYICFIFLFSV